MQAALAELDVRLSRRPRGWVVLRKNSVASNDSHEIFLVGDPLALPEEIPEKFASRVCLRNNELQCVVVRSGGRFAVPPLLGRRDMAMGGVWVLVQELVPRERGGPMLAAGMPVAVDVHEQRLQLAVAWAGIAMAPPRRAPALPFRVLGLGYHGTSAASWASISREGIRESLGMLGTGVYLAHFWKAASRYALRDMEYRARPEGGVVIRCAIVSWNGDGVVEEHGLPSSPECCCVGPFRDKCAGWRAMGQEWLSRAADHDSRWREDARVVGVHIGPETCVCDPRTGKRAVSNEEWCVRKECVVVLSAHRVDPGSDPTLCTGGAYDPKGRSVTVV